MGRPLTGTVKAFGTKFRASCPTERGSRTRIEPTFLTERAAQTWRAAAPATLAGGGTVTLPSQGGACPAGGIWAWPGSTQRRAAPRRAPRPSRLPPPSTPASRATRRRGSPSATRRGEGRFGAGGEHPADRRHDRRLPHGTPAHLGDLTRPAANAYLVHLVHLARASAPTAVASWPTALVRAVGTGQAAVRCREHANENGLRPPSSAKSGRSRVGTCGRLGR